MITRKTQQYLNTLLIVLLLLVAQHVTTQLSTPDLPDPADYAMFFEDGSFVALDGSTGCYPGWPCEEGQP